MIRQLALLTPNGLSGRVWVSTEAQRQSASARGHAI